MNPDSPRGSQYQPQGRWAVCTDPLAVRSVLETRSLQLPLYHTPNRPEVDEEDCEEDKDGHDVDFHPQSLDSLLGEEEEGDVEEEEDAEWVCRVPLHYRGLFQCV